MPHLDLRICAARNLPNVELFGKIDPYCTVELEGKQWRTRTIENTCNPEWNDVFKFNVADENSSQLVFRVWDTNVVSDTFLAETRVSISGLQRGVVRDEWVLLKQCKSNAELHLRILAADFGAETTAPSQQFVGQPATAYVAPQPGYGAPAPGYPPQQPGYGAPPPGYPPQQPGYPPQQPGYPPQQPGYPPQQPGYGAPPPGYPPQQPGYPPQQPGYPPQQPGYGVAPAGYPPAQPGYPGAYPPAQPGYPPAQAYSGAYPPPQQQGFGEGHHHHHAHHHGARRSKLMRGQSMYRGEELVSDNNVFRLIFQPDGDVVLYANGARLWATNTAGRASEQLILQEDGNLVLYAPGHNPVWASNTCGRASSDLLLQDDDNLVIYDFNRCPLWARR